MHGRQQPRCIRRSYGTLYANGLGKGPVERACDIEMEARGELAQFGGAKNAGDARRGGQGYLGIGSHGGERRECGREVARQDAIGTGRHGQTGGERECKGEDHWVRLIG